MKIKKEHLLSAGFPALFSLALLAGCSSEKMPDESVDDISETIPETVSETISEIITETSETTFETTSETELTALSEETSESTSAEPPAPDTDAWAHNFAAAVFAELENNKTSDEPTDLVAISFEQGLDERDIMGTSCSQLFFLDVNFDGVPELFTGGYGMIGVGRYSIYAADGSSYGTDLFTCDTGMFSVYDNCIYAPSGSNSFPGFTKFVPGLPQVHNNGTIEDRGNTVEIVNADGTKETLTDISAEEFNALFAEHLGADYDALYDEENALTELCIGGVLRVSDPENYTEDDIYNCIAPLLEEYMDSLE